MKFLADEHIELSIVTGLKLLGIDVISVNEAGKRESDDEEILSYAKEKDRVIITRNAYINRLFIQFRNLCNKPTFFSSTISLVQPFVSFQNVLSGHLHKFASRGLLSLST